MIRFVQPESYSTACLARVLLMVFIICTASSLCTRVNVGGRFVVYDLRWMALLSFCSKYLTACMEALLMAKLTYWHIEVGQCLATKNTVLSIAVCRAVLEIVS